MTDLPSCAGYIFDALAKKMWERTDQPVEVWTAGERMAVAVAANTWAEAHGMSRRVTVSDVERVEPMAMGHVDYGTKLALYVAELLYRPAAPAHCAYCDGTDPNCGFCEMGIPLDTQGDWDNSWGRIFTSDAPAERHPPDP